MALLTLQCSTTHSICTMRIKSDQDFNSLICTTSGTNRTKEILNKKNIFTFCMKNQQNKEDFVFHTMLHTFCYPPPAAYNTSHICSTQVF